MTNKPLLLDLFCGAGGAAMGYHSAGFEVVGVDIELQPHYPFPYCKMDAFLALDLLLEKQHIYDTQGNWWSLSLFSAIHASPKCQRWSNMTARWGRQKKHPDQITPTRSRLQATGKPYVIENVEGAPLINPLLLCGSMFGLGAIKETRCDLTSSSGSHNNFGDGLANFQSVYKYQLRRHRLFECSFGFVFPPASCNHAGLALPVYGHAGGQSKRDGLKFPGTDAWREGMGIDWMTGNELAEAIPPAYTGYIGKFLMEAI